MAPADSLPLSALQHLLFCERQAALIHVERLWADNRLTVEGQLLHQRAHDPRSRTTRAEHRRSPQAVRIERGMELRSTRLMLHGKADIVEFHHPPPLKPGVHQPRAQPPVLPEAPLTPFPIEYKRGRPKRNDCDAVQLCAQALCLEEMLGLPPATVAAGAIFYGQTRRRCDITFDQRLRDTTAAAADRLHQIIRGGLTPIARREPKCDRCSLLNLCLPHALKPRATPRRYLAAAVDDAVHAADVA
jgi:CRISPR-associated exonuclease Cas4